MSGEERRKQFENERLLGRQMHIHLILGNLGRVASKPIISVKLRIFLTFWYPLPPPCLYIFSFSPRFLSCLFHSLPPSLQPLSSPSPPIPVFFFYLCNHKAVLLTFSKLISISLKPADAAIAINLGETGSCVMPHSPDGVSG